MESPTNFEITANISANRSIETTTLDFQFRAALDVVPISLLMVDQDGRIEFANPEAEILFGYDVEELLASRFEMLVAERFRIETIELGQGFFAIPTPQEIDAGKGLYGLRKDGQEMPIEVKIRTVHHRGRSFFLCTVIEMAAWKRSQVKLSKRSNELSESKIESQTFAHLAAHDLQEPLRKVILSLQALVEDHSDSIAIEARRWVHQASEGAMRMRKLVTDLLAFSLFTSQGRPLLPIDPNETLRVAIENLAFAIKESSAELICYPLPQIIADEIQLISLFQNVIDNAIRYRRDTTPRIEIGVVDFSCVQHPGIDFESLREQNTDCIFYVRDNGIGIGPEYFERIFVAFQRLNSRHQYAGTGMGLAFCKKIIERHGGRIWLESTPGLGSTFYFAWGSADSLQS